MLKFDLLKVDNFSLLQLSRGSTISSSTASLLARGVQLQLYQP